jgi:hypothetical protein
LLEKNLADLGQPRKMIDQWVDYYNRRRLHAGIKYGRPVDYHFANPKQLIEIRKNKLAKARINRKLGNQRRSNDENRFKQTYLKSPICACLLHGIQKTKSII